MKVDPYTDRVLGDWKRDRDTKDKMYFKRSGAIKLHKDHAQDYIEPVTFKKQKVYGDVVLTETKVKRPFGEVKRWQAKLFGNPDQLYMW